MIKYSTKLGDKICAATAKSSIGLRLICQKLGLPYSTVTDWIYNPQHELHNKYIQAKQLQLHCLAEEVLTMTDELTNNTVEAMKNGKAVQTKEQIALTRLRMQARINIITKLAPALYKTTPEKTKHTVTMTPPPDRATITTKPEQDPQQIPDIQPSTDNQSTSKQINDSSSPKTTIKHLPDGTFEEYDAHGELLRKSIKHRNPCYADDILVYSPSIR